MRYYRAQRKDKNSSKFMGACYEELPSEVDFTHTKGEVMGTRGMLGFRVDGEDKLAYNHFDSYPRGLGCDVVGELKTMLAMPDLREQARALRMIDETSSPTEDEKAICRARGTVNLSVDTRSEDNWYCLLREAQGSLLTALRVGLMLDGGKFLLDSLFCEWAYIVNLDTQMLEVWEGFQQVPDPDNRYGQGAKTGSYEGAPTYYPCKMTAEYPLATVIEQHMINLEKPLAED